MRGWQPIETAPKDKLIFLSEKIFNGEKNVRQQWVGRWISVPHVNGSIALSCWMTAYPAIMRCSQGGQPSFDAWQTKPLVISPTHWKEIPGGPKS